ncbi:MAG: hypothetical protein AB7T06_39645 [Kofleriaceae bacterium]
MLKLLAFAVLLGAGVAGIVLLSGMVVALIIGGFTVIAVLYDSLTFGADRPRGVIVGEIDHDFGSTTQNLPRER